MFSLLQAFVSPFVIAFGGTFWHDTIEMIIPPTNAPIDVSYVPDPNFKSLIIGLTFGTPREYDPATGEVGAEILSSDVGVYHAEMGYIDWHWDSFVESILKTNPYPQLLWASNENPYQVRIVNNTGKYIWSEVTFWAVKFPKKVVCPLYGDCDPEFLFKEYMKGIASFFLAMNKVGVINIAKAFTGETPSAPATAPAPEKVSTPPVPVTINTEQAEALGERIAEAVRRAIRQVLQEGR